MTKEQAEMEWMTTYPQVAWEFSHKNCIVGKMLNGLEIVIDEPNVEVRDADGDCLGGMCLDDDERVLASQRLAAFIVCWSQWRPPFDYAAYLASHEWRERRNDALRRDGFRCQRCSATRRLQVHHLTYVRVGHEDPDDLVTLCARCHKHVDPPR